MRRPWWRVLVGLLAAYAVLLGVVLGIGWLLTHTLAGSVGAADDDLARWLAARRTPEQTQVADVGRIIGATRTGEVALGVIGVVAAAVARSWRPLAFVALTYGGIGGVYFAATHLDPRARPPVKLLDTDVVAGRSFPSGHVGTATAIVLCLALLLAAYGVVTARPFVLLAVVLALVPLFVLWARLYQGDHHLTDVLTALATALVWGLVCARSVLPGRRTS